MKIKSKVKIKDTDITAKVIQIGQHGLCLLSSDEFGVFDRTVYGPWELEEIKEEDKYEQII
ncbi:hypothetical protein KM799_15325 [Clostridium tyrobutyricum]|jgi:hypothetical protein|uniref:hypothetical protein n=1 Tax=Clostridium tyrobutyricum TaxID=1519 RepID=UPI00057D9FF1|nr:hypothetical protein [Clostridium tyrobutyricum]MBV4447961.1 hypothetical protein [Clostridium tyrobutyricum]